MTARIVVISLMSILGYLLFIAVDPTPSAKDLDLGLGEARGDVEEAVPSNLEVVSNEPITIIKKNARLREEYFKLMKGLEIVHLDLEGSHFDPSWLYYVSTYSLTYLDLSGTLVQDKHKALLQSFTNLKSLKLNNTSLTEECLNQLAIR